MANKYDLKTAVAVVGGASSGVYNIGTNIENGKTRFLTYIRLERNAATSTVNVTGLTAMVVSTAKSDMSVSNLSAGTALVMGLPAISGTSASGVPEIAFVNCIPDRPDVDHPILSMIGAGSTWMTFAPISSPGVEALLFAQYYDE